MNVARVRAARRKHVHPDVVERKPSPGKIKLQRLEESISMLLQAFGQLFKAGRAMRQIVERRIRRIALKAMLAAPSSARLVLGGEHACSFFKIGVKRARAALIAQLSAINVSDEKTRDAHRATLTRLEGRCASTEALRISIRRQVDHRASQKILAQIFSSRPSSFQPW